MNGWSEVFNWHISGVNGDVGSLDVTEKVNSGLIFRGSHGLDGQSVNLEFDVDGLVELRDCIDAYLSRYHMSDTIVNGKKKSIVGLKKSLI